MSASDDSDPRARTRTASSEAQVGLTGLESEHGALLGVTRLRPAHWLIIAMSVAITLAAWFTAHSSIESRAEQRFARVSQQTVNTVVEQLERYGAVLRASVASISVDQAQGFDTEAWVRYAERLDLLKELDAVRSLAIARYVPSDRLGGFLDEMRMDHPHFAIRPPHPQNFHLPIVHEGPARVELETLLGLDLAFEPRRRDTVMRAAYLDDVQMTPPIDMRPTGARGLLLVAPFYRNGGTPAWKDRREEFGGVLVASVGPKLLIAPLENRGRRQVWLRITDAEDASLFYDDTDETNSNHDPVPLFRDAITKEVHGRRWHFDITSTQAFRGESALQMPTLILAAGLLVDALLLLLFMMLTRSNRRAVTLAGRTMDALREEAMRLEASNAELEQFAYVVSHDLKTPLRGIHDLATYIEEDLEPVLEAEGTDPTIVADVGRNFERIYAQIHRASALIEGILDYSGVGTRTERVVRVDVGEIVSQIGDTLHLAPGQLRIDGELPVLDTCATRLEQVFANLIGNAFKYHHDRESATVVVSAETVGDYYRFSISDDGPGIDPRFHDRIFEVFKTLQRNDAIQSSGVGLSIVKKSVELLGGRIVVDSAPGQGTTFRFDWPAHMASPADVDTAEDESRETGREADGEAPRRAA